MKHAVAALALAAVACGGRKDDAPASASGPAATTDASPAPLAGDVDRTLDNGLRLVLQPVPGSGGVALVLLFAIGSDHDPPGQSGLAHLVEHLLVTAATAAAPARTTDEWIQRYPLGWNAQTGTDYTVVATVFTRDRLDAELAEAAARLSDVRLHPDDLAREVPRLVTEVDNMFAWAALGTPNRARERVRPTPHHGRKGGVPDQVEAITLEQAAARVAAHYRAGNAIVVLAGELDATAPERAAARFGALPRGEPPPAPPPLPAPIAGIDRFDPSGADPTLGCIAYRVPAPADPRYADLLVAAGVLMRAAREPPVSAHSPTVRFTPLDEPEVLTLCAGAKINDLPAGLIARLDAFTARALAAPVTPVDAAFAERAFGPLLRGSPDPAAGPQGLYTTAFSRARRLQLGLDPDLRARLRAVTDLAPARTEIFARRGAAVAVGE